MKNSLSASATPGRLHRQVTSMLLALSLALGMIAATASSAQAASLVQGCFRPTNPSLNVSGIPVDLQAYTVNGWVTISRTQLGMNGCTGWNINSTYRGYYLRMSVNHRAAGAFWFSVSPLMALPGNQTAFLGTGVVTCTGCYAN